jgi:peptidoglycan hydrolase-like protein with peptidoglycan-binding domain
MESLIFLHDAIAYEDPQPDLRFESWNLAALVGSLRGGLAFAVLLTILNLVAFTPTILAQAALQVGDQGDAVANLQRELRIKADGIFGPQTQEYVVAYQRLSGLPVTGVADAGTLAALGLSPEQSGGDRAETAASPAPVAVRPSAPAMQPPEPTAPVASNSATLSARSATVIAETGLNVRDLPGGAVVSWLSHNQTVQLTGDRQPAGRHYWVQLAQGGWVSEKYLKLGNPLPGGSLPDKNPPQNSSVSPAPTAGTGRVSAQTGLIVRSAPGGSVIGSLLNGQRVQVKGDRQLVNGRYWVQLAEGGWVAADYVALN